ncbi:SUMF1/EgtB/PvdO family nonheme iron enzyme [Myxococcota bacterium]|nr:SUMF1/EgtB/PvdO family nonheme iron enzyme [Myxococcota bacterium]MBU1512435.1 SUMF1/EgtB/PvdO family nonheme iron enzyme [Myxococcota bacterium]
MKNRTILLPLLTVCLMLIACDTKTKTVNSCGDGFLDPGEACDGDQMSVTTCAELGYYDQTETLTCQSDCTFDLAVCTGGRCGDGNIQAGEGEQCEGEDLNGTSCEDLELGSGTLSCEDCKFVVLACELGSPCGDQVASPFEACDGTDLAQQTCVSLGFGAGVLGCTSACGFDLSQCEAPVTCGNDQIDGSEQCDGLLLGQETCVTQGFGGGSLACNPNCSFSTSGCTPCGNGRLDGTEACDGMNLGDATCFSLGYSQRGGLLICSDTCEFNTSGCVELSANAGLSTLTVSEGTLAPAFESTTLSYTVQVPQGVTTVTVAATAEDAPYATVAITPEQPMALIEGTNPVTVTVTAEDGTQQEYTVAVNTTLNVVSPNIGTLIHVPAGTFQRDATATNLSVVSAFRMSEHEITRAQWTAVTGWADPSDVNSSTGTSDPVQKVSWYDAIAFCNKLSLLEGLTPVYAVSGVDFSTLTYAQIPPNSNSNWNAATANWAANGYRLPTEMEWMWAAMDADSANPGATNTTGYAKAFAGSTGGNSIDNYVWYISNSSNTSHPVGTKLPTELGFHDLSGNIWEYVWDLYGTYPTGTVTDYRGPGSGTSCVGRGGDHSSSASYCSVAQRAPGAPSQRSMLIGIRVARN